MDQNPYWLSISPTDLLGEDLLVTMLCCLYLDEKKKGKTCRSRIIKRRAKKIT